MPLETAPLVSALRATTPRAAAAVAAVGPWQLVSLAGRGTWSSVYRARPVGAAPAQPALHAVKLLHDEVAGDPRALALLCREARVGRRVSHPNLAPILAASIHERPYYLVMPYLAGQTVARRLAAGWRAATPEALWIARQVAQALAALATSGWLHGDVKPSNTLLSPSGHVTLIDLAFARRLDEAAKAGDGGLRATPQYLAPELLAAQQPADIRSDVYSLGVMLFELLAGRRPFVAADVDALIRAHRELAPPDLRGVVPGIDSAVAALVRQMLAKQPLRRPTPDELVERLAALEIATFDQRPV